MSKRQLLCMLILTLGIALIAGCVPLLQQYTLVVLTNGEGTVSIPGGQYLMGTSVSITATPKTGWKFDHWSGDAFGNEPTVTVIMNSNKNITAHFISTQYAVNTTVEGQGIVEQTQITTPQSLYNAGATVELRAVAAQGWVFKEWQGDITGNLNPTTITVNEEYNVKAVFTQLQHAVNTTVEGQGTVEQSLVTSTKNLYNQGTTVQLKAVPAAGWSFKEWQGDITGNLNPTIITVNQEYNVKAVFTQQTANLTKWNFLVYLDGDNDLEPFGIDDINEMEEIGSTQNMNILVLIDRHPQYDSSNGNWTGTRLYRITKDTYNSTNIVSELVQDYGELDMSDPQVLENFMLYCHQNYPAERTVLTLWDHGDGIYPKSLNRNDSKGFSTIQDPITVDGICWDDTTGTDPWSCLTTDEIASALANVRQVTGKKLDIINMDACLMQTLEVAYEWRTEANYLVGSQETVPGDGNNYETLLQILNNNPTMTTLDFAKSLVDDFFLYYNTSGEGYETYSALSLGVEFDNLINAFKDFASALYQTTDLAGVQEAWNKVTWFTVEEYDDLYDLSSELITYSSDANVKAKAATLQLAISNAIVNHKETTMYQGRAFGLSICLPTADAWENYSGSNQYVTFLLSKDTDWDNFILRFVEYTGSSTTPGGSSLLSVEITWPNGDCDLGIWEPDTIDYWVYEGVSPNGVFSEDTTTGGTETWTINSTHVSGIYTPLIASYDFTGTVNCKITFNGEVSNIPVAVVPEEVYAVSNIQIQWVNGKRQLTYNISEQPIQLPKK